MFLIVNELVPINNMKQLLIGTYMYTIVCGGQISNSSFPYLYYTNILTGSTSYKYYIQVFFLSQ